MRSARSAAAVRFERVGQVVQERGATVAAQRVERFGGGQRGPARLVDLGGRGFGGDDLDGGAGARVDAGDLGHRMPSWMTVRSTVHARVWSHGATSIAAIA